MSACVIDLAAAFHEAGCDLPEDFVPGGCQPLDSDRRLARIAVDALYDLSCRRPEG